MGDVAHPSKVEISPLAVDGSHAPWSWQAWGAGEWEPEADGEASSELLAKLAAERHAEQGTGPATDAARLLADAEVTP